MGQSYTKPFRGLIYDKDRIGDIASCVCPPYDVISDDRAYLDRSPFNAIRIELPKAEGTVDRYESARRILEGWRRTGVLIADTRETVYIYDQEFEIEGVPYSRRGFIALNKLDRARILTHEKTREKAKEDREKLIVALKAITSLVFGVYEDRRLEVEDLLADSHKEAIYDFVDEQSIRNRFYRMTEPGEIDRLARLMDTRMIYVADGHHRLDVSYKLNIPYIPLYLTNMYSNGIVILPYHRMVTFERKRPLSELLPLLGNHVDVEKHPWPDPQSLTEVLHLVAQSREPAFALYSNEDPGNLYVLRAAGLKTGEGPLDRLKVNILHTGILKGLLGIKEDEISFTQDPQELLHSVRAGSVDLAFMLPPTTAEEVKEVADHGLDMPPKSTFFYPKILTGLVYYKYA